MNVEYPFGEIGVSDHLRTWARLAPDRVVLSFEETDMTFRELDELSDRVAGWLEGLGVGAGDRVAVHLPNCPQFALAFHGILKRGAVHVALNPVFREHELAHDLADCGAEVVITTDELAPVVERVRGRTAARHVAVVALSEDLARGWLSILRAPRASVVPADLDALAALNYTGGTTGLPKGCEHTQRTMLYTAVTTARAWRLGEHFSGTARDAGVVFFPAFWIAGEDLALLLPVVTGTKCVLLRRWDPGTVLRAIERHRVTHMVGTVESYVELMDQPGVASRDLSTLRMPLAASFVRKLDVDVRRAWQSTAGSHSVIRECAYGMTETHTMDTCTDGFQDGDADLRARPVFCGRPMPGTEIRIVDFETGAPLPGGEEGEIVIRTPSLFKGYWRAPEATAAALRDGWLHTGDVGMIDEAGCLHYLGRNKEMIKVKGMSVFPAEIEALIGMHRAVRAVAVVPQDDPVLGQKPVAHVELHADAACTADELAAWVHQNMARYKVPEIHLIEALPRTDTGKIRKGELLGSA